MKFKNKFIPHQQLRYFERPQITILIGADLARIDFDLRKSVEDFA